jgi:hypothetical protein
MNNSASASAGSSSGGTNIIQSEQDSNTGQSTINSESKSAESDVPPVSEAERKALANVIGESLAQHLASPITSGTDTSQLAKAHTWLQLQAHKLIQLTTQEDEAARRLHNAE